MGRPYLKKIYAFATIQADVVASTLMMAQETDRDVCVYLFGGGTGGSQRWKDSCMREERKLMNSHGSL